jgi:hypothetical protein
MKKKPLIFVTLNPKGDQYRVKWISDNNQKIKSQIFDLDSGLYLLVNSSDNVWINSKEDCQIVKEITLKHYSQDKVRLDEVFQPDETWLFAFLYFSVINELTCQIIDQYKSRKTYNIPSNIFNWRYDLVKRLFHFQNSDENIHKYSDSIASNLYNWIKKVYDDLKNKLNLQGVIPKTYYIPDDFDNIIAPLLTEGIELSEVEFIPREAVSKKKLWEKLEPWMIPNNIQILERKLKVTTLISLRSEKNTLVLTFLDTLKSHFDLEPEKLIFLIEKAGSTVQIRPVQEKNRFNPKGVGQILGKLDMNTSQLVFESAIEGECIQPNRKTTAERIQFCINLDDLLPYYVVIKKQFEEKILFETEWLAAQSRVNLAVDI